MKINLIGDYVLVQPVVEPKESKFGFITPESASQQPSEALLRGVIVEKSKSSTVELNHKDTVLYSDKHAKRVSFEGQEYVIIHTDEIFAIL